MAWGTPQTPQTTVDLATHIHHTFEREALQANQKLTNWGLIVEGDPYAVQSGVNVSVPIEGAPTVNTTELSEDADGSPIASSDSAVLIPCGRYGHYLLLTQAVFDQKDMNTANSKTKMLVQHAIRKIDLIAATAALGGTQLRFVNAAADAGALLNTDVITAADFVRAMATLDGNDCPRFGDGLFKAVLHPYSIGDLFSNAANAAAFVQQIEYADPEALLTAEVGQFHGFKVIRATQLNVTTLAAGGGGGAFTADLVKALFVGDEFLGKSERRALYMEGPVPAGDLMGQLWVMRWKAELGFGRIKEANALRVHGRSAMAPNP